MLSLFMKKLLHVVCGAAIWSEANGRLGRNTKASHT